MMTQGSAIAHDEQAIAQAEFDQYIAQKADYLAPSEGYGFSLEVATQDILSYANFMATEKTRDKTEFKQLLNDLGWKGEEKRYLKVAAAFEKFSPQDLAQIEPATLFLLANNSKKYQPVFEQMRSLPEITQAAVRELIQQQRKPKEPKPPENLSIWRRTPNGGRYCQIPPIHETDQQTGVILQRAMDEKGLSPQTVVREALELWQAYQEGRFMVESAAVPVEEVSTEVSLEVQYEDLLTELLDVAKSISVDAPEPYKVEELESVERSHSGSADSWTSEPEQELDLDTVELGVYATATVVEEILRSLSPVDLLIYTFQTAADWREISSVLEIHPEYKQQAWDALTPLEKRRVVEITPEEIKKLSSAKKAGMIVDFREVRTGVYQVQVQGSLFWEVVISSRLDAFLLEL